MDKIIETVTAQVAELLNAYRHDLQNAFNQAEKKIAISFSVQVVKQGGDDKKPFVQTNFRFTLGQIKDVATGVVE